jgi:hypothetical protein
VLFDDEQPVVDSHTEADQDGQLAETLATSNAWESRPDD